MGPVDLEAIRLRARQRADQENSTFVTDDELNTLVNVHGQAYYDILISKQVPYNMKSFDITTTSGTDTYNLPVDFYKLAGVDIQAGARGFYPISRYQWAERHSQKFGPTRAFGAFRYAILGKENQDAAQRVRIIPEPGSSVTIRVWYYPLLPELENDDDTIDGVSGWEEYVVIACAIDMMRKEESDTIELERDLARITARIEAMAEEADYSEPAHVVDTEELEADAWWWG